ncbi:hypothetical protein [Deinococcus marmoris]|uniref:hypothetical protein n=1 Tax=Deinococcus marmoris TaxID=249408 RepID=UPI000497E9E3|nr:hypothetical protein [Deinococcus marmoris]
MTDQGSLLPSPPTCDLSLTPDEYRLMADLLLEHLEANHLRDERLEGLVNRLYILAVRAVHPDAEPLLEDLSAQPAHHPAAE